MVAAFLSSLLNTYSSGFQRVGVFGTFSTTRSILYEVNLQFGLHLAVILPTVVLGIIGGALGAVFTALNIKVCFGVLSKQN